MKKDEMMEEIIKLSRETYNLDKRNITHSDLVHMLTESKRTVKDIKEQIKHDDYIKHDAAKKGDKYNGY